MRIEAKLGQKSVLIKRKVLWQIFVSAILQIDVFLRHVDVEELEKLDVRDCERCGQCSPTAATHAACHSMMCSLSQPLSDELQLSAMQSTWAALVHPADPSMRTQT